MQTSYRAIKIKTQCTANTHDSNNKKARDKVCICLVDKGRPNVF